MDARGPPSPSLPHSLPRVDSLLSRLSTHGRLSSSSHSYRRMQASGIDGGSAPTMAVKSYRAARARTKAAEDQVTFEYGNTSTQARTQSEDASGIGHQPEEYVEPWDNVRSNYPVTLPLRRPYSGDPEVLNRLELGEGNSSRMPLNENKINAAQKLGFMETDDEPKMIFLQLPSRVLLPKPPNEEKGAGNKAANLSSKTWKFKDIPTGFMGKLLVYRNGKVKMKWEDVLFDVNPGIDCAFAEEIVTVNAKEKHYCVIGELTKHAVVTPDIDSLLGRLNDSDA